MKPTRSILDPAFKWIPPAKTDVGRHLRAALREQRKNHQEQVAKISPIPQRRKAV